MEVSGFFTGYMRDSNVTMRHIHRWVFTVAAALGALWGSDRATAADPDPQPKTVVIRGGTILTLGVAGTLDQGTLVMRKGRIASVRKEGRRGMPDPTAVQVDASGKFVTPGLIDAWTNLGIEPGGSGQSTGASHRVLDALNSYDQHVLKEAWRGGVTAICVEPQAAKGIVGTSALIRLKKLNDLRATATEDVNLVIRVGIGEIGPLGRLAEIRSVRSSFEEARTYRETWEDYEEAIEDYAKELKEGKTVKLKKEKKDEKAPKKKAGKSPRPRRRGRRRPRSDSHVVEPADEDGELTEAQNALLDELTLGKKRPSEKKDDKKDDSQEDEESLTKPERPGRDIDKEVLVRTLKRELPVRFEVHRPADIVNVLALIQEFNLDATVSGGSGAGYVAKELADAEVTVILGRTISSGLFDNSHTRDLGPQNASRLKESGVFFAIGSGASPGGVKSHYLAQNAAIAVGQGLDRESALRAITINAARLCGAEEEVGSLEADRLADVVIWSGHPLAADSVVERVFVGGEEVYRREN